MTDWCPYCRSAKKFFEQRGVDFKSINVEKPGSASDVLAIAGIYRKEATGVPYMLIEDQVVPSFNKDTLKKLLCIIE